MRELSWQDFQWCLRRTPQRVLELLQEKPGAVFVGGGYVRAVVANESVNDIDLFTTDKDSAMAAGRFLLALKDGQDAGRKIHKTDNAFTVKGLRLPIQIIHRWTYTSPDELMASFDFTVAMAGFWWEKTDDDVEVRQPQDNKPDIVTFKKVGKWRSICDDHFYEDLAAKRLRYTSPQRNEDAGGSMLRVLKFYQRGYCIPLDSMGAVIARLMQVMDLGAITQMIGQDREQYTAKILTGLLREVDPNIDPEHIAHLPSIEEPDELLS
jgi:hypothetical protein